MRVQLSDVNVLDDVEIVVKYEEDRYPYDMYSKEILNDDPINIGESEFELIITAKGDNYFSMEKMKLINTNYGEYEAYVSGNKAVFDIDVGYPHSDFLIEFEQISISEVRGELINVVVTNLYTDEMDFYLESGGVRYLANGNITIDLVDDEILALAIPIEGRQFSTIPIESYYYSPISDNTNYEFTGDKRLQTFKIDNYSLFMVNGSLGTLRFSFTDGLEFENAPIQDTEFLPYNHIYKMTNSSLNEIANYSYVKREIKSSFTYDYEILNYSKYIVGLYSFPYNIEFEETDESDILLGDINTQIKAEKLPSYLKDINLGVIEVNDNLEHNVGFKNFDVKLFVPYFDIIDLEVEEVLGYELSIMMRVNIMNGYATLNIYNSKSDSIIYSDSKRLGFKIPYYISESLDVTSHSVLDTAFTRPYVQIKVLEPDNEIMITSSRLMDIDNYYQFMKDDDTINIKSFATAKEQELIKNNIRNGIFVRKGG